MTGPRRPASTRGGWWASASIEARFVVITLAHIPLAVAASRWGSIATLHAAVVLSAGLLWSLDRSRRARVPLLIGYMVSAELLWRITGAAIPWETGKYAGTLLLILSAGSVARVARGNKLAVIYLAMLVPSTVLLWQGRDHASFYLSGPLLLAVATLLCASFRFTPHGTRLLIMAMVPPLVSAATLSLLDVVSDSNEIVIYGDFASAGYGSNQVSSMLGLGTALCIVLAVLSGPRWFRTALIGLAGALGLQSLLTLSRGGVLTAAAAIAVAMFHLVRNRRLVATVMTSAALLVLFTWFVAVPLADEMTSGLLSKRYAEAFYERDTTRRAEIVGDELDAMAANPILGLGPGGGEVQRGDLTGHPSASHTEYTRLLAEHGIFGAVALACLLIMAMQVLIRRGSPVQRALSLSCMLWSLLFMAHSATRLAAPAFLFGLSFAEFFAVARTSRLPETPVDAQTTAA